MNRQPGSSTPEEKGPNDGVDFNDPDRDNSEQNEEGTQAQDVADDALRGRSGQDEGESEPPHNDNIADVVPRDVPDLVSVQKSMLRSGTIDMDAFAGEPKMDDEDS